MLIFAIINNNKVVETSEAANIEIEQNEIPEIIEEENNEEEQAQELTEEQQKEAEKEENIEKKDDKQNSNNSNKAPSGYNTSYYIKVNYGANVVTIYTKDEQGNYNPIKAMVCSTGRATPRSGTYKTSTKWRWAALFGNVYGQYATRIKGNILFHSVPYTEPKTGSGKANIHAYPRSFAFASMFSRLPNSFTSCAAVFGPTLSAPFMLSAVSPVRDLKSA